MTILIEQSVVHDEVLRSLQEDVGTGDVSAAVIAEGVQAEVQVITREAAIVCGRPWVDAVFAEVDDTLQLSWLCCEGESVEAGAVLFTVRGSLRSIVTAERTALNWLQMLSGTATLVSSYVLALCGLSLKLLDTRKTLPGLRRAQKYAVVCGGGCNHRFGLHDAFLIKENHIMGAGSITAAVSRARASHPELLLEVEVETLSELREVLPLGVDVVMLDNFSMDDIEAAVSYRSEMGCGGVSFEVSGLVARDCVLALAQAGVDAVSVGAFTKNVRAIDLSLQVKKTWMS